jgi:hypothetical protein
MARRGDGGARYFAHTSEWKWSLRGLYLAQEEEGAAEKTEGVG